MAANADFSKMVPGFDFLQGLMKGAGAALPGMGQWVAPTLDPDELNKRIEELRTVQFWLEQNARLLATTIQALEVQRMTLSTLKTMNLQVGDLAEAFALRPAPAAEPRAPVAAPAAAAPERPAPAATGKASGRRAAQAPAAPGGAATAGLVDPMQWWGALTQQFTEIATKAIQDSGIDRTGAMAGAMGQQATQAAQAAQAAGQAMKAAAELPARAMKEAAKATQTSMRAPSRKAPARRKT
jgi:hypothetical protein